ncbi:hypothetical protein DdX_14471 [Ditylenchus destructor]|uniref:Uncharacterized protein n=1 Tax=Ditylenchus destructor TaxID=166010 RepID=A0AAD4MRT0_9BILA|nr:hypothetical protein DdX_14471 [Ditylenchus destructor]
MYEFKSHASTVTYGELSKLLQDTTGLEEALARETRCSARQAMSVDKKLADITANIKLKFKNSEQKIQRNLENFDQRIGVGVKISTTAMSLVKKMADIKILELRSDLAEEGKQALIAELTEMRAELNGPEANVGEGNAENRGKNGNELNEDQVSENDEENEGLQDLTAEEKTSFEGAVTRLTALIDSPKTKEIARQQLNSCRQMQGESVIHFAERLIPLVRAATAGQDEQMFKQKLREDFLQKLLPKLRFFVRTSSELTSFEQVRLKAQEIEGELNDPDSPFEQIEAKSGNPESLNLSIYKPMIYWKPTEAWACRKTIRKARFYTNWLNDHFSEELPVESVPINIQDCDEMIVTRKCAEGKLLKRDSLYTTDLPLDLDYPWPFFGSFSWSHTQVINCFMFRTSVSARINDNRIITHVGNAKHCTFNDGSCEFSDKTLLVWYTDLTQSCPFQYMGTFNGTRFGEIWTGEREDLVISISNSTKIELKNCFGLIKTEQGLAIRKDQWENSGKPKIFKRSAQAGSTYADVGIVTSPQLASQLSFVSHNLTQAMIDSFIRTLDTNCDSLNQIYKLTVVSALVNPTLLAREILSEFYVHARMVTSKIMQIWPCVEVELSEYELIGTGLNNQCFEQVPITLKTLSGKQNAFLDPINMIISEESRPAPCETHRVLIIQLPDSLIEFDQITGTRKVVISHSWNESEKNTKELVSLPAHIYHNLVIANASELLSPAHYYDLIHNSQIAHRIEQDQSMSKRVIHTKKWGDLRQGLIAAIVGEEIAKINIWNAWVTLCCLLLSLYVIFHSTRKILDTYYRNRRYFSLHNRNAARPVPTRYDSYHDENSRVQIQDRSTVLWSRKLSCESICESEVSCTITDKSWMTPGNEREQNLKIKSYNGQAEFDESIPTMGSQRATKGKQRSKLTHIFSINGINVIGCIDTGSPISIVNKNFLKNFREPDMVCCDESFQDIALKASTHLRRPTAHTVQTRDAQLSGLPTWAIVGIEPGLADWKETNMIIGRDWIAKLPPISIDYSEGDYRIGKKRLEWMLSPRMRPTILMLKQAEEGKKRPGNPTQMCQNFDTPESNSIMNEYRTWKSDCYFDFMNRSLELEELFNELSTAFELDSAHSTGRQAMRENLWIFY